jgi:mannose-6-phosphate isomerase-like protein (cupin superfamily)
VEAQRNFAGVVLPGQGRVFPTGRSQAHVKIEAGKDRSFAVFEAAQIPGVPGPPQHVHRSYDEAWYVIEGRMEFRLDEDIFDCPAGSVIYAPRGTAHTFHNPGPEGARLLAFFTAEALSLVEALGKLASGSPPQVHRTRQPWLRFLPGTKATSSTAPDHRSLAATPPAPRRDENPPQRNGRP